MTNYIIENIKDVKELHFFSQAYKEGLLKVNISKLSRELNATRKTVRRYLNGDVPKTTRNRTKYLDNYKDDILNLLEDKNRKFEYIDHIYSYMVREHKIDCARSTFNRYIRNDLELSELYDKHSKQKFTVRFETNPGQQVQFDLKERLKLIYSNGDTEIVNVATLTLGYSRYNFRKILVSVNFGTVSQFLAECFELMDGVPKELVIDNTKVLVEKPRGKNGSEAILNPKFVEFLKDYNIECLPCMPYRPQTKGKTETQNKKPSQLYNYNGTYKDLDDIHTKLEMINIEDNNSISQATKLPRVYLYQKEKDDFNQLPTKAICAKYHLSYNKLFVSNESLISYKSKKYSVPKAYIGKHVDLVINKNSKLQIYYNNKIIAQHDISDKIITIDDKHNLYYPNKKTKINNQMKSTVMKEMERISYD